MTALNTIEQIAGNLGWSLVWGAQKGRQERTFVEFHHQYKDADLPDVL